MGERLSWEVELEEGVAHEAEAVLVPVSRGVNEEEADGELVELWVYEFAKVGLEVEVEEAVLLYLSESDVVEVTLLVPDEESVAVTLLDTLNEAEAEAVTKDGEAEFV